MLCNIYTEQILKSVALFSIFLRRNVKGLEELNNSNKSVKSWWTIYGMRLCQLTCLRRKRSSNKKFPTWKSLGNFLAAEQQ